MGLSPGLGAGGGGYLRQQGADVSSPVAEEAWPKRDQILTPLFGPLKPCPEVDLLTRVHQRI